MTTTMHPTVSSHAPLAQTSASPVRARFETRPDAQTMRIAASALGIDHLIVDRAVANLQSGRVVAAVFSGKMASGKDTVAEEIAKHLVNHGLPAAVVHRTSDPIRAELDEAIALIESAASQDDAVTSLVEKMNLLTPVAQHLVDELYDLTRTMKINASDRTDLNRHLLQYLADAGRRAVDPGYWIKQFFARMVETLANGSSAFLTGGRYPNEIGPAQSLGMMTIRLDVSRAVQEQRLTGRDGLRPNPELLENPNECALDDFVGFNLVISNEGELHVAVDAAIHELVEHAARMASR